MAKGKQARITGLSGGTKPAKLKGLTIINNNVGAGGTGWNGGYSALGGRGAVWIIWGEEQVFPLINV